MVLHNTNPIGTFIKNRRSERNGSTSYEGNKRIQGRDRETDGNN